MVMSSSVVGVTNPSRGRAPSMLYIVEPVGRMAWKEEAPASRHLLFRPATLHRRTGCVALTVCDRRTTTAVWSSERTRLVPTSVDYVFQRGALRPLRRWVHGSAA
jgi:hypothetical protein